MNTVLWRLGQQQTDQQWISPSHRKRTEEGRRQLSRKVKQGAGQKVMVVCSGQRRKEDGRERIPSRGQSKWTTWKIPETHCPLSSSSLRPTPFQQKSLEPFISHTDNDHCNSCQNTNLHIQVQLSYSLTYFLSPRDYELKEVRKKSPHFPSSLVNAINLRGGVGGQETSSRHHQSYLKRGRHWAESISVVDIQSSAGDRQMVKAYVSCDIQKHYREGVGGGGNEMPEDRTRPLQQTDCWVESLVEHNRSHFSSSTSFDWRELLSAFTNPNAFPRPINNTQAHNCTRLLSPRWTSTQKFQITSSSVTHIDNTRLSIFFFLPAKS